MISAKVKFPRKLIIQSLSNKLDKKKRTTDKNELGACNVRKGPMGRVSSAESSETQVLDHHFCKMTKYVIILQTGKLHNIQQTRYLLFYYTLQRLFTVITSSNKGTTTTTTTITTTTTCFTLISPPLL